jgi:preprotein translocase subunit SecD
VEGFTIVRLGVIGAIVAGSCFVLLPTLFQEDADAALARQAAGVASPASARPAVDLEVELDATEGDPAALAEVLGRRLSAASVPHTRVTVEGGQVVAKLLPGGRPDQVRALALAPGELTLWTPSSLVGSTVADPGAPDRSKLPAGLADALEVAGADLGIWTKRLPELAGMPTPPTALSAGVTATLAGATTAPWPSTLSGPMAEPFAIAAVDGAIAAVVVTTPTGSSAWTLATNPDTTGVLVGGPLPGALRPPTERVAETTGDAAEGENTAASRLPTWLADWLPDTKMNLGLDLQGGIDLTLQVELDEAVQGQVARDAQWLVKKAADGAVAVDEIRADRSDPVVWVTSAAPLAEIQAFVRGGAPDYEYLSSNGNAHGFRMKDVRAQEVQRSAVDQVTETLRKRVDATGVKEPAIVKKGGGRINVQLPGKVDLQQAVDALGTTAVLEFRLVDEEFDESQLEQLILAAKQALPEDQFLDDELLSEWLWSTKRIDEEHVVAWEYTPTNPPERFRPLALRREVVLTGADVNDAGVNWDQNQQPYVSLDFKPRGAQVFCEVTTAAVGKRFAIMLDGEISSAPVIRDKICGGSAKIDMSSGEDPTSDAQTLALVLRTGSLDAPVVVGEVRNVGAQLGKDSVRAGLTASGIGSAFVVLFMLVWYRVSGVVANLALGVNVVMMLAGLALFGATLTLPGIAGIALTVGMAVDANIIIYERIRDELKLGVNPRKAVDMGFENATSSILDSNITTAIAGVVLYSYGTGPLRGFAVTLLVGIVTTLVSALFVSRSLMEIMARNSNSRLSI